MNHSALKTGSAAGCIWLALCTTPSVSAQQATPDPKVKGRIEANALKRIPRPEKQMVRLARPLLAARASESTVQAAPLRAEISAADFSGFTGFKGLVDQPLEPERSWLPQTSQPAPSQSGVVPDYRLLEWAYRQASLPAPLLADFKDGTGFPQAMDNWQLATQISEHYVPGPSGQPLGASVAEDLCTCGTGIPGAACLAERVNGLNGLPPVIAPANTPASTSCSVFSGTTTSPFYGGSTTSPFYGGATRSPFYGGGGSSHSGGGHSSRGR